MRGIRQGIRAARRGSDQAGSEDKTRPRLSSVWREARSLVWAWRGRLSIGLLLIIFSRLCGMIVPASSKFVIDNVIGEGRTELLMPLMAAAGAATLLQAATSFGLAMLLGMAAQRAITDMRRRVQQQVMRLPVSFFDQTKSGVLIARIMNDAEGLRNLVGSGLVQLVGGLFTASLATLVLIYLNWQLTVAIVAVLLGFAAMMARAFMTMRPLFRQRNEQNAVVTGRLTEALGGVRIVKAYAAEKREDRVFAGGVHALLRLIRKTIFATSSVTAGTSLVMGVVWVVAMTVGTRAINAGTMSLGDLVSYFFFVAMVAGPLVQISSIATQLSEAFAGLDRIRELLHLDTEADDDRTRGRLGAIRGDVEVSGVSFEYLDDTPVIRDISFEAPAGTTTALVGSSGSGKSTLIGLITTFLRPKEGQIRVDGHDLESVRLSDYRKHLGIVLQDNFLFDGTVADNISYSKPGASREEITAASKIARCHDFVEAFDQGYDTIVGERGVKLSGGQRQRVAIARAILADPTILVLDEATSSLDSESELLIQDGLRALRKGRTTFVIAHRLSTIQSADQILVIEDGRIVERGTHESLLALDGRYRELYEKQHRMVGDRYANPGEVLVEPETATADRSDAEGHSDSESGSPSGSDAKDESRVAKRPALFGR